ncbi:carboxypeptidase-like regulatory domain-containing protein [Hymenobacter sp. HSC-4F20]|uniref:carboxypeptidase-like regulatory domain-containing protein n=1 Tax=Hymenobacter sp. HSC-4F20 TaxID=2864135 RepID=UPI001C72E724|nr:carboxypeptidase-like regulatory domain-containing protein [Hymenobacter sp. HSC-4F20]MBX0289990.1 carboxypeptidase-like regulatory domain-containing protein [Hymenobacter sp. HSC-4F20]
MNAKTTTRTEPEEVTPELLPEDEELSSGNGRLAVIVGILVAVVVLGYVLLPAQATRRIVSAMPPSMQLGEANVTGHRLPEETKVAEATAEAEPEAETPAAGSKTEDKAEAASPEAVATAASDVTLAAEPVAIEPVPAAAPAATEAAPATVTVSGRILDEEGQPLAGATVLLKGSHKATGTDANGNYTLEVPAGDNTLVYGYGGYEDQELHSRNGQTHNVTLVPREDAPRRRRR